MHNLLRPGVSQLLVVSRTPIALVSVSCVIFPTSFGAEDLSQSKSAVHRLVWTAFADKQ